MSDQTRKALLIDLDGVVCEGERAVDTVMVGDDVRPTAVLDAIADLPDC